MSLKVLFIPIIAGVFAQILKVLIDGIKSKKINLRLLNMYGGMPSSHTALVVSLTAVAAFSEGLNSIAFAIALVFSVITIRDAIGFRMYLSEHAAVLNKLIAELPAVEKPKFPSHVIERVGHTRFQALVGGLVGLMTTIVLWIIIP